MTPFIKIRVFKIMIILLVITTFFVITGISKLSDTNVVVTNRNQKFRPFKLVRRSRETIVGNGCPKGRFRYYGKCKSYEQLRENDYDDIDSTNEALKFTPTTTVRDDKFVEAIETDINLSIVPLSRPEVITESNVVNLNTDVKTLKTVEMSTLLETKANSTVTTQISEATSLKTDVSVSSLAMTDPLQLEAAEPRSAVTATESIRTDSKPTFEEPKTVVTEPNQFIDELSGTVVDTKHTGTKLNPIVNESGSKVTEQQLLILKTTFAMTEITPESSVPTTAVTESIRSIILESKSKVKQLKTFVTVRSHMLHALSSKVTKVTETIPSTRKSRLKWTQQTSTVRVVNTSAVTESTPLVLATTTAMADTVTTIDSALAFVEISPVGTESKSVMTGHVNVLKDAFRGNSAAAAKSIPTWTGSFSNFTLEPTSLLTDTSTTVTGNALITTDVPSKVEPGIIDQNDKVSNILLDIEYFMITIMLVVGCVILLNWIYEPLYGILYRRGYQENRVIHLSKEEESMV